MVSEPQSLFLINLHCHFFRCIRAHTQDIMGISSIPRLLIYGFRSSQNHCFSITHTLAHHLSPNHAPSCSEHTFHISHVLRTLTCYFLPTNAPNLVSDFHSPCYTIQMLKMHTVVILCQSSSRFFKSCTSQASSSSIVIVFKGFWWVLNHWTHTVVLLCQSSNRNCLRAKILKQKESSS